jgi:CRISPR-associated protein Csd2
MIPAEICEPQRRYDAVLLFDVSDGNPNGDPDSGNLPRVDPDTLQGLVSDVALKRRIRDYVDLRHGTEAGLAIYVQSGVQLSRQQSRAYEALGFSVRGLRQPAEQVELARAWMCRNFFDIRMFGAVMTTGVNCGQVRGPLQTGFARSIDPVTTLDLAITRMATVHPRESDNAPRRYPVDLGRKPLIPYGLFRAHISFYPVFAERNGVSAADLALVWRALLECWDDAPSASRGRQACRGLHVFRHTSPLGDAPSHHLCDRIQVVRRDSVAVARSIHDYEVTVQTSKLPSRVEYFCLTA